MLKFAQEDLVIDSIKGSLEIKKDAISKFLLSKVFLISGVPKNVTNLIRDSVKNLA